jgi:hypothetical protein
MDLLVFFGSVWIAWTVWSIVEKIFHGFRRLFSTGGNSGDARVQERSGPAEFYGRIVFENCRFRIDEGPDLSTGRDEAGRLKLQKKGNVIYLPSRR